MKEIPENDTRREARPPGSDAKKAYRGPELLEWGSVLDLTQGGMAGGEDGDFSGTNPFFFAPPPR